VSFGFLPECCTNASDMCFLTGTVEAGWTRTAFRAIRFVVSQSARLSSAYNGIVGMRNRFFRAFHRSLYWDFWSGCRLTFPVPFGIVK